MFRVYLREFRLKRAEESEFEFFRDDGLTGGSLKYNDQCLIVSATSCTVHSTPVAISNTRTNGITSITIANTIGRSDFETTSTIAQHPRIAIRDDGTKGCVRVKSIGNASNGRSIG